MPEDEVVHTEETTGPEATFHRRVVTTETVKRGDLYVPLADRFDKIERRVSLLTWIVVIDAVLTVFNNQNVGPDIVHLIAKLIGA